MTTICRAYASEESARAAVGRLLAAEVADSEIRVVMGAPRGDLRDAPVGGFADTASERVGAFAGAAHGAGEAMGAFAGDGDARRGSFGDLDRESVTTYQDGVRRVTIASHRDLERMLIAAGLDEPTAAADVKALHDGRVLVLVRAEMPEPAIAALDA